MNILLVGINSKYTHSNLAIRCLQHYLEAHSKYQAYIAEYTVNQPYETILGEIYRLAPDILGFSCAIWNIELVKTLTLELRTLLPNTVIVWGGPEVSYESEQYAGRYADYLVKGEGEQAFLALIEGLNKGLEMPPVQDGQPVVLDEIPFVYQDLQGLENRTLYYESSRGCPFQCQYCLSSIDKRVHFHSLERVYADLDFFLKHKVRQVKFVDRTFNCDRKRTMAIWQYLLEHDNGVTNFHFEIAGELLDEALLKLLEKARPGYFQMEIGVQSLNLDTLAEIRRVGDFSRLSKIVRRLQARRNIHLHLDLIAGLPYEDIDSFIHSFNGVYALAPDQLQLGFLKVLKGSGISLRRELYGIVSSPLPPYEVRQTAWISFDSMLRLKRVEDMLDRYYNSGRYRLCIQQLCSLFPTPFACYDALGDYFYKQGYHLAPISETDSYTVLFRFFQSLDRGNREQFCACAKADLHAHKRAKKQPDWMDVSLTASHIKEIKNFYQTAGMYEGDAHVELFPLNPLNGEKKITALLFQYNATDLLHNAQMKDVTDLVLQRED